jgi:hypothetical protein
VNEKRFLAATRRPTITLASTVAAHDLLLAAVTQRSAWASCLAMPARRCRR